MSKLKGPVLDRVDIYTGTTRLGLEELSSQDASWSSEKMRAIVLSAQEIQQKRFQDLPFRFNSQMGKKEVEAFCILEPDARTVLNKAFDALHLTARGYYKTLKVARTVADVEQSETIKKKHILEAVSYRNNQFDR